MGNNIKENNIEKSLVIKGEGSLTSNDKHLNLIPYIKTVAGILFYVSTFIVSVAVGYIFIFSVFN